MVTENLFMKELDNINHIVPYVWVITHEESRFIKNHVQYLLNENEENLIYTWSICSGVSQCVKSVDSGSSIVRLDETSINPEIINDPRLILGHIKEYNFIKKKNENNRVVFILKDFNQFMVPPIITRELLDMRIQLIKENKSVIIVSPQLISGMSTNGKSGVDISLEKYVKVLYFKLPSKEEVFNSVSTVAARFSNKKTENKTEYTPEKINEFTRALQGLTTTEINDVLAINLRTSKIIETEFLIKEKKQIVQKNDILEFIEVKPSIDSVGGLDEVKTYLSQYCNQFDDSAVAYGVEPLKGVLFVGIPGNGKSLISKAIASLWNLPLIRLDVGRVFAGLVGSSEANMRGCISVIESVAPCVLIIDEIEKALGGTKSSNGSDGGTLNRVFGTLLTAMEEGLKGVTLFATANDIKALPSELIRRFNEVFFVDLPNETEREQIFNIHLNKRGRDAKKLGLNLTKLVSVTEGFTGSEIEKVVKESIVNAFQNKQSNIKQENILNAIKSTRCISIVMKEQIKSLQSWAKGRARYASSQQGTVIKNTNDSYIEENEMLQLAKFHK